MQPASQLPSSPVNLWPDDADHLLKAADMPRLTFYPAAEPTGAAVIVLPGGGYWCLADHEGEPVARWLSSLGIHGIVLNYRHRPDYAHPHPLNDAQRAIRQVRHYAGQWGIDAARIGILGFSAGGHLAATASTLFEPANPQAADPLDRPGSRPDLSILLYPVITLEKHPTHGGSRQALLGNAPAADLLRRMCPEEQVTAQTPPAFLFHTLADDGVPMENSLLYAAALRQAKVAFELHIYERGNHGVGLAAEDAQLHTWPLLCGNWLKLRGFARA